MVSAQFQCFLISVVLFQPSYDAFPHLMDDEQKEAMAEMASLLIHQMKKGTVIAELINNIAEMKNSIRDVLKKVMSKLWMN